MRRYRAFVLVVILISLIILVIHGVGRYQDFKSYHNAIADRSVKQVRERVESYIQDRQRLVWLFADEHKAIIQKLFDNPEDTAAQAYMNRELKRFFPLFFAFTIANSQGKTLLEDFDGYVGEICERDIRQFAETGIANHQIHPNNFSYHFDVITKFDTGKRKGILFVSFKADALAQILRASEVRDHSLWLIAPKQSYLMEVTSKGARIKTVRNDYRMTRAEKDRILSMKAIKGTAWSAIDLRAEGLFSRFILGLVIQAAIVLSIIILISLALLRWLCREERKRQQAEQARDDFLAVVSHELRTPLTAIKGAAGLVSGKFSDKNASTSELMDMITRNADKLTELVDDLLDLRKMEAGKMEYEFEDIDLCEMISQSIQDNQAYASDYKAKIELARCVQGVVVRADRGRLMQVMTNLLSNAVKYGGKHDTIVVAADRLDDYVEVAVTDHGDGIAEQYLPTLFDKFTQIDGGAARRVSGTGLGLSIVEQIILMHGGTVGVESEIGKGSTFYFCLPIVDKG